MRRFCLICLLACALSGPLSVVAAVGKVNKVLPHFLDTQGRHTLSPSLFDRDAYQAKLRQHAELRSGIRFDVSWRVRSVKTSSFKLRIELRGVADGNLPRQKTLEQEVKGGASARWTSLKLTGDEYREFGEVTAWRATLWDGEQLLGEQKSFLW